MIRVYLDQNKWIDLARAQHGRPDGKPFEDALLMAQKAVESGHASFVLSAAHYYETHRQLDWERRGRLVTTMLGLSRLHAIAPPHVIVPWEVDTALHRLCQPGGSPAAAVQIFGIGAGHALGTEAIGYSLPQEYDGLRLPAGMRSTIERQATDLLETGVLLGPPPGEPDMLDVYRNLRDTDQRFADGQTALAERLAAGGLNKGDGLARAISADEMVDFLKPLIEAAASRGIDLGAVFDRGRGVAEELLRAIPSRWVTRELRRLRHANPQKSWEPNDLNDVVALSIAVPYCDIVVTERQWTHQLTEATDLGTSFGTRVISDLQQLPELLVTADL